MGEERQRVLRMLKDGKVTIEEGEALLEALGEAEEAEPAGPPAAPGTQPADDVPSTPAGATGVAADGGRAGAEPRAGDRRTEFHRMLDDLMKTVDVDGIMETVRESLKRSKVDVDRVKEEVLRATGRVREETRRAAREYRRHGWGRISRTIEGLWGLTPAAGAWSHEADLEPGRRVAVQNLWGDVTVKPSADGRVRATAVTRAWGRDQADAAAVRDGIGIAVEDAGPLLTIRVEPPAEDQPRRFRVDIDLQVPAGVAVEISQSRGDVTATGLRGECGAVVASGDVTVRDQEGAVRVEVAKGDVTVARAAGDVRVKSTHGDVTLSAIGGAASAQVVHGDITMRDPAGPVSFDFETAHGDILAHVERFAAGTTSRMSTMSGDLTARLGEQAACRLTARVTAGEIAVRATLAERRESRRVLQGVYVSADAALELATVSGDVTIETVDVAPTDMKVGTAGV